MLFLTGLLVCTMLFSDAQDLPRIIEAESANLGSDWEIKTDAGLKYITSKTDLANPDFPGNESKLATFNVTFPDAGFYDLYVKVRIGKPSANSDSFFYARKFGKLDPNTDNYAWVLCNGLFNKGYIDEQIDNFIDNSDTPSVYEWKWVNVSIFSSAEQAANFKVKKEQLTQNFQIGGREDGLEIDKIAFCLSSKKFTVQDLNQAK